MVAALVSAAVFLSQGVASAAPSDGLSCDQVHSSKVDCKTLHHDGVDGLFIGPVQASRQPQKGSSPAGVSVSGGSAAGTATTGSATTGSGTGGSGTSGSGTGGSGSGGAPSPPIVVRGRCPSAR